LRFHKKVKLELPYHPVILLLGIYPKEWDSGHNRDTCTPMSIAASIYNSQALETTQMTYNWWMDQENVVRIHTLEYYSAIGITMWLR
jgi:hypothetical protein